MLKDSKILFNIISKKPHTYQKSKMLEFTASRETFYDLVISDIGLCEAGNTSQVYLGNHILKLS